MRLHLVDGTYELFRAHYSHRPEHVHGGRDLKATVGLAESLLALLADVEEGVTHLAVAFDNPIRSVRNDWYEGYKSDDGVPAPILAQFDAAEVAARALGVVVWSMDRYEADDALATAAKRWRDQVDQVRIMTPDKDLGQCLATERVVLVDRMRRRVIDEKQLFDRRGIRPGHVPDWLALVGDAADGIPGIEGFGEKSAAALLRAFDRLEGIPRDPHAWPAEVRQRDKLAKNLAEGMKDALLYRKLATLFDDVPLRESLDDLRWRGPPRDALQAWSAEVGASAIGERARSLRHG